MATDEQPSSCQCRLPVASCQLGKDDSTFRGFSNRARARARYRPRSSVLWCDPRWNGRRCAPPAWVETDRANQFGKA
jgi:hypothetical protein